MMKRILNSVVLPTQVSDFERSYLQRMNKIGLLFFCLHVPVFVAIAYFNDTGPLLAAGLCAGVLFGPALAFFTFENPRNVSLTYGFTAMLMGGVLVHVGQGPVQIEMHFYFFALLAMLAIYGNPLVILVAAVTVTLHHLVLWAVLPSSVFNYDAPFWVVLVHAAFVVLESVATCYIARNFFDNVIGLERIVEARTAELDSRNRDMRLVLDNVDQGFLTIDRQGVISPEHSAILERWLGSLETGTSFAAYLRAKAATEGELFELGFESAIEGFLPLEATLDQLPKRFAVDGRSFTLQYTPIFAAAELQKLLIMITDVTSVLESERLELEQREMVHVFDRLMRDRPGFLEFFDEARDLVTAIGRDQIQDLKQLKRIVHTLKGNSAMFGLNSIANQCHQLETGLEEEQARPTAQQRADLTQRFERLRTQVDILLGDAARTRIEVEPSEYEGVMYGLAHDEPRAQLVRRMTAWKLEPTSRRLNRIAEQAQRIASRLNKGPLNIVLVDNDIGLEPAAWASFWSSFVHVVRNAVDHGIESKDERLATKKHEQGTLELTTRMQEGDFVIEIKDDGHGINWAAVADRARAAGIAHQSSTELMEAIFTDGISTATRVSELSGRGIGMGAIRAECSARGGTVEVSSSSSAGTRVVFRFPKGATTAIATTRAA